MVPATDPWYWCHSQSVSMQSSGLAPLLAAALNKRHLHRTVNSTRSAKVDVRWAALQQLLELRPAPLVLSCI